MGDNRNYAALEWVIGEIEETLNQARQALEAYVADPKDSTRMRFCLTYVHQVYGTLQMVEFHGAAMLAEEMEKLAQSIVNNSVENILEAEETLMRAILQLPIYLDRVKSTRCDDPVILLPILNDMRAVRQESLLTETALFKPDLSRGLIHPSHDHIDAFQDEQSVLELLKKLRQMFQFALVGVLQNKDVDENLNYLNKVCARLHSLTEGTPQEPLWPIALALLEGLANGSISASVSVKNLLRQIDELLKRGVEFGRTELLKELPHDLIRNMLYYVARSRAASPHIQEIKELYDLDSALPGGNIHDVERAMDGPEPDAMRSVVVALLEELSHIKAEIDIHVRKGFRAQTSDLKKIIPIFKRVADTMAVLGIGAIRRDVIQLGNTIAEVVTDGAQIEPSLLMDIATKIISVEAALEKIPEAMKGGGGFDSQSARTESERQFDQAQDSVIRESRNGLEQAKQAVIEFIASQWDHKHLEPVPGLLAEISGGLTMVSMQRAAKVLDACALYIIEGLLTKKTVPEWSTLDTLADAITSVEYFLERQSDNTGEENNLILEVAEESLAELGYDVSRMKARPAFDFLAPSDQYDREAIPILVEREPIDRTPMSDEVELNLELDQAELEKRQEQFVAPGKEQKKGKASKKPSKKSKQAAASNAKSLAEAPPAINKQVPATKNVVEKTPVNFADDDDDLIDEEIIEIFIEEAAEVLNTINECFPKWAKDFDDEDSLAEFRRAFHTLKGSGRMVGAEDVGELAWAVENILNRMIDGTITPTQVRADYINRVRLFIPNLVEAFQDQKPNPDPKRTYLLMAEGQRLATKDDDEIAESQISLEAAVERMSSGQDQAEAKQAAKQKEAARDKSLDDDNNEDDQPDVMLWDIFRGEAEGHIAVVDEFIQSAEDILPQTQMVSDNVQRALHTLKGSAHMADITIIADVVSPLEKYVKELRAYQLPADTEVIELLKQGVELINDGLGQLAQYRVIELEKADEYIDLLVQRHHQLLSDVGDQATPNIETGADPRMLAHMLQNEMDLILDANEILDQWLQSQAPDIARLEGIIEELQALQTAAEKAALRPIAALAGLLEDAYLAIHNKLCGIEPTFIDLVKAGHDALVDMMDQMAAEQSLTMPDVAINNLSNFLEEVELASQEEEPDFDFVEDGSGAQTQGRGKPYQIEQVNIPLAKPPTPTKFVGLGEEDLDDDDDSDIEILEVFLEEATELLENIDEAIHDWLEDKANTFYMEDLQRLLHTLKGGSRLATMMNLGDLSHDFETFLIEAQEQKVDYDQDFFTATLAYYDQLSQALDRIRLKITGILDDQKDKTTDLPSLQTSAYEDSQDYVEQSEDFINAKRAPLEYVKVSAELLEDLVNLAGETSISRARLEEQSSDFGFALEEMSITIARLQEQLRRLDIETEAQVIFRLERTDSTGGYFDPLEMDRYSHLQQLSRSLMESAFDLHDIRITLLDKIRNTETLLVQQARINTELQEGLMRSRMVPFSRMVPRLRRIVRQVSTELHKQISFELGNIEGELDRTMMERMIAPLEHMLRNAVDHGIESVEQRRALKKPDVGRIRLSLSREGGDVVITLVDDGQGINLVKVREKAIERGILDPKADVSDFEIMQFILRSGFSTATEITQISGRGVGMDVVNSEIKLLGGSVSINSVSGQGTEFKVRLPFTVSVNRALMVNIGDDLYAIPLNTIEGIVRVSYYEMETYYTEGAPKFVYAAQEYDMRYMGALLSSGKGPKFQLDSTKPLPVILVRSQEHSVALQVDGLMGSREIVVKSLGPQFSRVKGVSGATVLGDGSVVIILDLHAMIRAEAMVQSSFSALEDEDYGEDDQVTTVMVVDDSVTVRKVTSRLLERHGYRVLLAKDGADAMLQLQDHIPDVMLLDIEMPRMDGFEVAASMRSSSLLKDIPIIMITSRTGDKHKNRALSMGVNKYMGKPFQETVLLQSIEELMMAREN